MTSPLWKIGELAERTGLTVRTLHHYEELGLLEPSHRSSANYRLYTSEDIARLQLIVSLKNLGLSLEEIKTSLDKPDVSLAAVMEKNMHKLREQMTRMEQLLERLDGMVRFSKSGAPGAEDMLKTIQLMHSLEGFWTDEEMAKIREQGKKIGKQAILDAEQEWPRLIAQAKVHMESGTDPTSPEMRKIAKRWKELVDAFTGGNPEIAAKLKKMYEENPNMAAQMGGPDAALREYVNKAMEG